ncbi:MAG: hypothetical protein K2X01_09455 [Cyanobacteria bacterium]|nr:hypothetical protein [Cyanobacteriota bacterium]
MSETFDPTITAASPRFQRGTVYAEGYNSHGHGFLDDAMGDFSFWEMFKGLSQNNTTSAPVSSAVDKDNKDAALKGTESSLSKTALKLKAQKASEDSANQEDIRAKTTSKNTAVSQKLNDLDSEDDTRFVLSSLTANDARFLQQVLLLGLPVSMMQANKGNQAGTSFSSAILDSTMSADSASVTRGLSKGLSEALKTAYKSNQSVRIDIDNQASVVLKFSQGKVSAEFLSSEHTMTLYLKQHLDELRQRLAAKNLPVGDVLYKQQQQQDQRGQKNQFQQDFE